MSQTHVHNFATHIWHVQYLSPKTGMSSLSRTQIGFSRLSRQQGSVATFTTESEIARLKYRDRYLVCQDFCDQILPFLDFFRDWGRDDKACVIFCLVCLGQESRASSTSVTRKRCLVAQSPHWSWKLRHIHLVARNCFLVATTPPWRESRAESFSPKKLSIKSRRVSHRTRTGPK